VIRRRKYAYRELYRFKFSWSSLQVQRQIGIGVRTYRSFAQPQGLGSRPMLLLWLATDAEVQRYVRQAECFWIPALAWG